MNSSSKCNLKGKLIYNSIISTYQGIKQHSEFHEHLVPDCYHPSYYWNQKTYTYYFNIFWCIWQMTTVSNIPWKLKPTILSPPMLLKYQHGILYPYLSMHKPLISELWVIISSTNCPPWTSSKYNNLSISISGSSYFNKKSVSLKKISLLQELYSSTWINFQRVIKSNHEWQPKLQTSSYSLTTMGKQKFT